MKCRRLASVPHHADKSVGHHLEKGPVSPLQLSAGHLCDCSLLPLVPAFSSSTKLLATHPSKLIPKDISVNYVWSTEHYNWFLFLPTIYKSVVCNLNKPILFHLSKIRNLCLNSKIPIAYAIHWRWVYWYFWIPLNWIPQGKRWSHSFLDHPPNPWPHKANQKLLWLSINSGLNFTLFLCFIHSAL